MPGILKLLMANQGLYQVNYLVQAGGGAGGGVIGGSTGVGGGGAGGGLKTGTAFLPSSTSYAITPGAGGAGVPNDNGLNGGNSSIGSLVLTHGGGGGGSPLQAGLNGGSGGGGGTGAGGGTGISGEGFNGTIGNPGGAGGAGSGAGPGPGVTSSISGSPVTYGLGGNPGPTGGVASGPGGGGGGGDGPSGVPFQDYPGDNGNAGIVIISYPTGTVPATGGTITTSGGNTIHTFTSPGTFAVGS